MPEFEREAVPGSAAHRAVLRDVLDGKDRLLQQREADDAQLAPGVREQIRAVVDSVYRQPVLTPADLLHVLENLLDAPEINAALIYSTIEDHRSGLVHQATVRAYLLGLEHGRRSATDQPNQHA
jgi:hypothetical protein